MNAAGDCLIDHVRASLESWNQSPFSIPGDWFNDEYDTALNHWQVLRNAAVDQLIHVLDNWEADVKASVRS